MDAITLRFAPMESSRSMKHKPTQITPNETMKNKLITLTLATASALTLSHCGPGTRPAHRDAAVGAGLGAAAGAIIGNQSGNATQGALIGAAAGGGTGYAVGRSKERKAGY